MLNLLLVIVEEHRINGTFQRLWFKEELNKNQRRAPRALYSRMKRTWSARSHPPVSGASRIHQQLLQNLQRKMLQILELKAMRDSNLPDRNSRSNSNKGFPKYRLANSLWSHSKTREFQSKEWKPTSANRFKPRLFKKVKGDHHTHLAPQ